MYKVRDLISGSLRLLGVTASGETLAANELQDALYTLNEMMDSWSTESLFIYSKAREEFPLVAGQQTYTMGPLGNFDTSRPLKIETASVKIQNTEIHLEILNDDQWAEIGNKSTTGTRPSRLYTEGTSPFERLNLWPVPNTVSTLVLYSWKPLNSFATANVNLDLPPGYLKALRFNLALALAPEYGKEPTTALVAGAIEGRENIKRMNIKEHLLGVDEAVRSQRTFNIITGR